MKFDPSFVQTLERLNVVAKRLLMANFAGRRIANRKGASIEFFDYRHYSPGDEIRYIDWNVYARHNMLFIKEFAAEQNVHIAVALDTSASMGFGTPTKWDASRVIGAALSYIGLAHFDSVSVFTFSDQMVARKTFLSGKSRIFEILNTLEALTCSGRTDLAKALRWSLPRLRGRTVFVLVTDFYDLPNYREALKQLLAHRVQVHVVHLLSREEMDPAMDGRMVLRDAETGVERELYVSAEALELYRQRMQRFLVEVTKTCGELQIRYARALAHEPLDVVIPRIVQAGILEVK